VRRTGLGNRITLLVIGLILFAGGGLALVRGLAVWPHVLGPATAAITDKSTRHWVDDQSWFWPTVAAVAVLAFLLALRWIAVQGRTRVLRRIALEPDSRRGVTYLPGRAVTSALEEDLTASPYVRNAHALLTGSSANLRLVLSVTLGSNADPPEAIARIREGVNRMRAALEAGQLSATIRIRAGRPTH
jgi:hypothetical protein